LDLFVKIDLINYQKAIEKQLKKRRKKHMENLQKRKKSFLLL